MTTDLSKLSRRERQIMHILFRLDRASVAQVRDEMEDAPSYSAVRAHLATLKRKGHVDHISQGAAFVYSPTAAPQEARASALSGLVRAFFAGSPAKAAMALVEMSELDPTELDELERMIQRAREEGR